MSLKPCLTSQRISKICSSVRKEFCLSLVLSLSLSGHTSSLTCCDVLSTCQALQPGQGSRPEVPQLRSGNEGHCHIWLQEGSPEEGCLQQEQPGSDKLSHCLGSSGLQTVSHEKIRLRQTNFFGVFLLFGFLIQH